MALWAFLPAFITYLDMYIAGAAHPLSGLPPDHRCELCNTKSTNCSEGKRVNILSHVVASLEAAPTEERPIDMI